MAQVILSLSVPVEIYNLIQQNATKEGITKAEYVRRVLSKHFKVMK